jgi:hypothetical protein
MCKKCKQGGRENCTKTTVEKARLKEVLKKLVPMAMERKGGQGK